MTETMSLLADFDAFSPELPLGPTIESMPALEIQVERTVALDPSRPIAFCWFTMDDVPVADLEQTLDSDVTISAFENVTVSNGRALYRIRQNGNDSIETYRRWVEIGGELLDCRFEDGLWNVRMRFPDRQAFTEYHEYLEGAGVDVTVHRLSASPRSNHEGVLTQSQHEALVLAHDRGFFEIPRETSLEELAAALGISEQAVSERLRRGQGRLIERHVR